MSIDDSYLAWISIFHDRQLKVQDTLGSGKRLQQPMQVLLLFYVLQILQREGGSVYFLFQSRKNVEFLDYKDSIKIIHLLQRLKL